MKIKCAVAGFNFNGEPDLYFVEVECTEEEYHNGDHYDKASKESENDGFEHKLVYDENDPAGKELIKLFWS